MIDTHCHLDFQVFQDQWPEPMIRAAAAGISNIMIPGIKRQQWDCLLSLVARELGHHPSWPRLHCALGLHPYFLSEHSDSDIEVLARYLDQYSVKVIGEIGLDQGRADFMRQISLFEQQLALAADKRLPVILHSYKTHSQVVSLLRKHGVDQGVVHSYSGSFQDAVKFIDQGMSIGVGGVITWPRATKTRDTIRRLPLDALVLETDAPDSPVEGKRRGEGHPEDLLRVMNVLVALRPESEDDLRQALFKNSARFIV